MVDKNAFLIALSESERTDFGRVDFAAQPEPQKVFSAIWGLESDVNNGGFLQYFESWDAEWATFAPAALRAIGAHASADIVERALRTVSQDSLPDNHDERARSLESVPDETRAALDELDSEFFAYPDDLTELLFSYVAAHPGAFGEVPDENV